MPSRRIGRPVMVVAMLIAFSVLALVFVGEGLKAYVRKDGVSLGRRDFTFGLHWQTTIKSPDLGIDAIPAQVDCSHGTPMPTPLLVNGILLGDEAIEAGSTTVAAVFAQGTNTVSFALQGRSDMVSVILANINSLVSHPTGGGNSARDATGLLAIAMAAKPRSSVSRTAALSIITPSIESLAAFELLKEGKALNHYQDSHSEDCDCDACNPSPVISMPMTVGPYFPVHTHELMARAAAVTVTETVTICPDKSTNGPSSNSTESGPKSPAPAPDSASNSTKPNESSNPISPSRPNPPFSNSTEPDQGGKGGSAGASAGAAGAAGASGASPSSSAIANAASYLMGNSSQPTGNAQPSNNAANPPSSATSSKSSPADNTAPASAPSIKPPIASQASAASSILDSSIIAIISHARVLIANIAYGVVTIAPVACVVIIGQVWLL